MMFVSEKRIFFFLLVIQVIPDSSKTLAFARLIVDFADFKRYYDC